MGTAHPTFSFTQGEWTLKITADGHIISLADRAGRELVQATDDGGNFIHVLAGLAATQPESSVGAAELCRKPVKVERRPDGALFEYDLTPQRSLPLHIRYEIAFTTVAGFPTLKRSIAIAPTAPPFRTDVKLTMLNNIAVPGREHRLFTPRYNGIGEEVDNTADCQWAWVLNGGSGLLQHPVEQLAIPLISDAAPGGSLRVTHIADPFFTTGFQAADAATKRNGGFTCVYTASKVPMTELEQRTFWTVLQTGGPEKAMEAWYATALADVPPGPDWLHDVALQHYDYMSHGGRGWFEDIDAMEKLVPKEERSKVVFTLHGWYDLLGRYTFDEKNGKLDDEWTAFPSAAAMKEKFPTSESVKMSKAEMNRRIRYAKDRGFRVCVYFADGMAACDTLKDVYSPDQVLRWGGWIGPDTMGKTYIQNPAHPRVYARYLSYLKALLAEYGNEIDALVWDETFHVLMDTIGGDERPAYVARAMMRLVRDCTLTVQRFRPGLAFMTSDCAGVSFDGKTFWLNVPPYAIMSHGCYQDSHCEPLTWPYGVFPNYRNVLWSCNWNAVTRFDYTTYGVHHYRVPVATSNGWLDDKGIARLTPVERDAVMSLFGRRKTQRQQLRWLAGPPPAFQK